jgi:TM2 domain-containing membrane protein YozV
MKKAVSSTLISALVFPGAGQFNNRQYLKGLIMIAVVLVSLIAFFVKIYRDLLRIVSATGQENMDADAINQISHQVRLQNADIIQLLILFLFVIWIYGMVDAYVYGKKIDQR